MEKRGLVIVIAVLLILSTSVIGNHGDDLSGTPEQNNSKADLDVSTYEKNVQKSKFSLPDLVIKDVKLPKEVGVGTQVYDIEFDVVNIGLGDADGGIRARVEFDGIGIPTCRKDVFVGGSRTGIADKRLAGITNDRRYAYIASGARMRTVVNLGDYGKDKTSQGVFGCTNPLNEGEYTFTITVNPPGASRQGGTSRSGLRGEILESDETNNVYVHKMKVSYNYIPEKASLNFVRGLNPFTVPVKTKTSVNELREKTGCEIHQLNEKSESFSSRKTIDINNLDLAPLTDILSPETAYFASCDNSKITVSLEGSDPGPFNKKLVAKGLTFIPTRNNMASKKLFEFVEGCSGFNFGKSTFKTFTQGQNGARSGQILMYDAYYNSYIQPGKVYAVYCGSSFGSPKWDPASFEEIDEETDEPVYTLRGDRQFELFRTYQYPRWLLFFGFSDSAIFRAHHFGAQKVVADK